MAGELNDEKRSGDVIISSKDFEGDEGEEGNRPSAAATDPNSCLKIFLNMGENANNKNTEALKCRKVLENPVLDVCRNYLCTIYKV